MLDDWDEWLQSVGALPAFWANMQAQSHLFHSGSPLKPSSVRGRRLVVWDGGGCGGVKGRRVEGGTTERLNQLAEERKLCHIQEEVWVSRCTFFKADSALYRKWEMLTAGL